MILAYKKTLGKFTKVLGFEKTHPLWEKFPKNPFFFFGQRPLAAYKSEAYEENHTIMKQANKSQGRAG